MHLLPTYLVQTYLLYSVSSLKIRIIAGTNGSHWCRFIACIWLSRIFEVRIRSSRAVHTNITCHIDVGATVWFTHHSHNYNLQIYRSKINDYLVYANNPIKTKKVNILFCPMHLNIQTLFPLRIPRLCSLVLLLLAALQLTSTWETKVLSEKPVSVPLCLL